MLLLFTAATTWKPPKRPWTDGWIKKMWCMYTMEYYSAIKGWNMPSAATQMNLEIITLSAVRKKKTNIVWYYLTRGIQNMTQMNSSWKQETHRHREQTCGCQRGRGEEKDGLGVWREQRQTITCRMDRRDPTVERRELHSIPVISLNGKEWVCVYIYLNHFAVEQKLTQHCKSTTLQRSKF